MTILPRAATAPELAKLRSPNQSSRLYLTVQMPAQVYVARVAATPSSTDNVASITYNSGSGTVGNVLVNMTMYVSATGYGNYDKGMVRIRGVGSMGAVTGSIDVFTSEINWTANDYLTIVDAFDLWPRTPYGDNMDYSIAYTDQHSKCASIPVLGGRYKVKWLTGATVSIYPDASSSWALNNTITSVQWAAPGASATSGMTTNTPTITYNAANFDAGYRTSLTLTNSDGVTSVGYGRVFVLASENDAITQFRVDKIEGSYQSGGWSAQITMYGQADLTVIRDRALCIIHRRDWYGDTEGSIGYVADDENIEMVGWIAGDTIKWAPHWKGEGAVTFTIQGPQYWLNKLTMPAVGLKNISSHPPTNWKRFTGLTAKSATWHILYWRTTAPACIDVFPIDNAWGALQLQGSGASTVWQQITTILNDFLIAKPCCDSLGRLFMQIEQNCLPASTRSSIPTVMTVTTQDWMNAIDFERREVQDVAAVDLSGDIYDGTTSTPTFSLSPGRTFGARGSSVFVRDRLVLFDQASANALAGAVYGWQNNPYPKWKFQLASNMHLIDLAPYQYLSTDVVQADTQRGFAATGLRLIPRTITRTFNNGVMLSEVDVEAEALIGLGITGDTPAQPPSGGGDGTPINPPPDPTPLPSGNAKEVWLCTQDALYWAGDYFSTVSSQPTWNKVTIVPGGALVRFAIVRNGSSAYMQVGNAIYQTTTPKTPAWSVIVTPGDAAAGDTISTIGTFVLQGTHVYVVAALNTASHWAYGDYNGTTWIWSRTTDINTFPPGSTCIQTYAIGRVVRSSANALLEDMSAYGTLAFEMYRSPAGTRYVPASLGAPAHLYLHQIGGANLVDMGVVNTFGETNATYVYGAETGNQIYCVSNSSAASGHLWLSDNGSAFTDVATWANGWVRDAAYAGGGSLVWILKSVLGSNVPTRLYLRNGTGYDKVGNFWSLTSGDQAICGMGLTY